MSGADSDAPTREPSYAFDDSRRLTGPNRYFAEPAVILTPLGSAAAQPAALEAWAARVRVQAQRLGWPDAQPVVHRHATGTLLVLRAPRDAQVTATELAEWAWERAAAAAGETTFDLAQDLGEDPVATLRLRAAAERTAGLRELREAALQRRVPLLEDDAEVSLGGGTGSRRWPRSALPDEADVPWSELHGVPTALVTGSNGKTTTVRLLAAMAAAAGFTPGYSCTEGVFVGGGAVLRGDYSGPDGARTVLRRRDVAVLETARGGILRRGLAVERATVAVVTNIQADHFGEYGVQTAHDLAQTKLVVARVVCADGVLVLNADDATLLEVAARLPHARAARRALFAFEYAHPALAAARDSGAATCGVRAGRLVLSQPGRELVLGALADLPLTLNGTALYNVGNLAGALLAAAALGLPDAALCSTVRAFGALPADNPGRLERRRHRGADVLIDYAHNPAALELLLRAARGLKPARLSLLLGQAGNRGDEAIGDLARTAARFAPDRIAVKELPLMLRGRPPGEVSALLERALLAAGVPAQRIVVEADEEAAAHRLLAAAQPGELVVLPVHTRAVRERLAAFLDAATDLAPAAHTVAGADGPTARR